MAGRTGKMTAEEIVRRGPRMVLARQGGKLIYFREDQQPVGQYSVIARSYSLSYLKRLEKYN